MTSAVIQGYLALGYQSFNIGGLGFNEVSGGSYARQALNLTGNYQSGLSQTSITWPAATTPASQIINVAGIFTASTGGTLIATFPLVTSGTTGSSYTLSSLAISLDNGLQTSFDDSGAQINLGALIGLANGQPLTATAQLNVQSGNIVLLTGFTGEGLIAVPAGGKFLVQIGGVTVASIDGSGNLILAGTSTASGSPG
jgi:hypothetical protein